MRTPHKSDSQNQEVNYEQRFKDTQKAYTQKSQENANLAREKAELQAQLVVLQGTANTAPVISADEQERLDDLMTTDPQAWRAEMNKLEADHKQNLNSQLSEAGSKASADVLIAQREEQLSTFQQAHSDIDIVANMDELPARITKQLEEGKVDYPTFLQNAYDYLKSPKVIGKGDDVMNQKNLSESGGDDTPTKGQSNLNFDAQYEDMEF